MKIDDFFSEENLLIFNVATSSVVLSTLHLLIGNSWPMYGAAGFAVFATEGLVYYYHHLYEENRNVARALGLLRRFWSLYWQS